MEKSIEQKVKEYMEILGVYVPEDPDVPEEVIHDHDTEGMV